MNLKRKCQVVMLPTNEAMNENSYLFLYPDKQLLKSPAGNQHLYIISDDKIKEGDYIISLDQKRNKVIHFIKDNYEAEIAIREFKSPKIIATTDKLATEPYQGHFEGIDCTNYIPQPSPKFIQRYIEEYNKGNKIEWVNVEYEVFHEPVTDGDFSKYSSYKPKIDRNNYITITKVKDNWSREEIIRYSYWLRETSFNIEGHSPEDCFDKYIEENL